MKTFLIVVILSMSTFASSLYASDNNAGSKTIKRELDISEVEYDPEFRAAYRIAKKMRLSRINNPTMCGDLDGAELYNLLAEGEVLIPSTYVFSALEALLIPEAWSFKDEAKLYNIAFIQALKKRNLKAVTSSDVFS